MDAEPQRFADRTDAGNHLARKLSAYGGRDDLIVLALPRGGLPVACQVARFLDAPLDVFVVRKLGVPGQEELAMGAIASGDVVILNQQICQTLGIDQPVIDRVLECERRELARREQAYRGDRPRPDLEDRCVIIVDDGLATGASMEATIRAIKQRGQREVVVAIPVSAPQTLRRIAHLADAAIAVVQPESLLSVGQWYDDFSQLSDPEVRELLEAYRQMRDEATS